MSRGLEANATMSRLYCKKIVPKLINAQIEQDQMLLLRTPREKIVYETPQAKSCVQFPQNDQEVDQQLSTGKEK